MSRDRRPLRDARDRAPGDTPRVLVIGAGTGSNNDANQPWREPGALDGKSVADFEMFNSVTDEHGRSVTFYNDPRRLPQLEQRRLR